MDNLKVHAETIKEFENIASHTECSNMCKRVKRCSLWTYHAGACVFKNNMVYNVDNSYVTSGKKHCHNSGNIFGKSDP